MQEKRIFRVELSGWNETMCYTILTPAGTNQKAVVNALMAGKPIAEYHPNNWTPQIAYRCSLYGWNYGCGIDGMPDIRL